MAAASQAAPIKTRGLWIAALLIVASRAGAGPAEPTLSFQGWETPEPTPELRAIWMQDFFDSDEVWRFPSEDAYFQFLDSFPEGPPELMNQLRKLYRLHVPDAIFFDSVAHMDMTSPGGFVVIPTDVRSRMPHALVESFINYQADTMRILPGPSFGFSSADDAETFFSSPNFTESESEALRASFFKVGETHLLALDRLHWSRYPEFVRNEGIRYTLSFAHVRTLKLRLVLTPDTDLAALAAKYAAGRDPRPIERYLRKLLGSEKRVEVPLQKILHPFIRQRYSTFAPCHGPNCHNAGLNAGRTAGIRMKKTDGNYVVDEVLPFHRFVEPGEKLAVGDLVVYVNKQGAVDHTSRYIGDGLVFTKNGVSKYSPYVIQPLADNVRTYFPAGDYQLMVFRKPEPGRSPVGRAFPKTGAVFFADRARDRGCLRAARSFAATVPSPE